VNYKNNDNKVLVCCDSKGLLSIYDLRVNHKSLSYDVGIQRGIVTCLDFSRDERNLYLGTLGGYIINYDFRLNSAIETLKYNDSTPIRGLSSFITGKDNLCSTLNQYNKYLLVWTSSNDYDLGLWNLNTMNCDMLFKVNSQQGKEFKPLSMELPILTKEERSEFKNEALFKHVKDLSHLDYIHSEFYLYSNKRISKVQNFYESLYCVYSPIKPTNENYNFFITGGNDNTIRYWDITKDCQDKSFLINCPNRTDDCKFSALNVANTMVLQSNEIYDSGLPKKEVGSFAEYQNYNGISFNLGTHHEFEENLEILKYCVKVSDAAHRNVITDISSLNVSGVQVLVSSSWDGTIKLWK
jgi:WD40 repeat protein